MDNPNTNYKKHYYENKNKYIITAPKVGEVTSFSVGRYGKYTEKVVDHFCLTGERLNNYYEYKEDYAIIHLYSKKKNEYYETKIDLDDVERCKKHSWYMTDHDNSKTNYAITTEKGTKKTIRLHRFVMGVEEYDKTKVDHENGNGLDNRKCNLRLVDDRANSLNRQHLNSNNTTGATGVYRVENRNGWRAEWVDKETKRKRTKLFKDGDYGGKDGSFNEAKSFREKMYNLNHKAYIDENTK